MTPRSPLAKLNEISEFLAKASMIQVTEFVKLIDDEYAETYLLSTIMPEAVNNGIDVLFDTDRDMIHEADMKRIFYDILKYVDTAIYQKYVDAYIKFTNMCLF